jgi:hypothetical protein
MNYCVFCGKEAPKYCNYCDGMDCIIGHAKANGGQEYRPNGLPITCIRADGTMLEQLGNDIQIYHLPFLVTGTVSSRPVASKIPSSFQKKPRLLSTKPINNCKEGKLAF